MKPEIGTYEFKCQNCEHIITTKVMEQFEFKSEHMNKFPKFFIKISSECPICKKLTVIDNHNKITLSKVECNHCDKMLEKEKILGMKIIAREIEGLLFQRILVVYCKYCRRYASVFLNKTEDIDNFYFYI